MTERLLTQEYLKKAAESVQQCIMDKQQHSLYHLRNVFLLPRFAEGKEALKSYQELLERSDSESADAAPQQDPSSLIRQRRQENVQRQEIIARQVRLMYQRYRRNDQYTGEFPDIESLLGLLPEQNADNFERDAGRREKHDRLLTEEPSDLQRLLFTGDRESRILLIANAGFGKTTLLQRMMLALAAQRLPDETEETRGQDMAFLRSVCTEIPHDRIPCMIRLRGLSGKDFGSFAEILTDAAAALLDGAYSRADITAWIGQVCRRLILLIDGIDELSGASIEPFLKLLGDFLEKHGSVPVIMTTRVAGIDSADVREKLASMRFRGRTILPLNESEARQFCTQWVEESGNDPALLERLVVTEHSGTQQEDPGRIKEEKSDIFMRNGDEIYQSYLRDFMRKPLELTLLLQYLPRQSYATSRWDLFYHILWWEITNHVAYEHMDDVFEDECKLMGLIACWMQLHSLTMSFSELEALMPSILRQNYYTDLFGVRAANRMPTAEDVWEHLKCIAQNYGTIEVYESNRTLTIPLRPFQEYLTACTCCTLSLEPDSLEPDPIGFLKPHLNDQAWAGVIGFVISGLQMSKFPGFSLNEFLCLLYAEIRSAEVLNLVIERDNVNTPQTALQLCRSSLKRITLDPAERALLEKCMATYSAGAFRMALGMLYREQYEAGGILFQEAAGYVNLIAANQTGVSPLDMAAEKLCSGIPHEQAIGAEMIVLAAQSILEDTPDYAYRFAGSGTLPAGICRILYDLAAGTHKPVFVQALTEIYNAGFSAEDAAPYLDRQMLEIACEALTGCSGKILDEYIYEGLHPTTYWYLYGLVCMIGTFPYHLEREAQTLPPIISLVLSRMYKEAFLVAGLNLAPSPIIMTKYHFDRDIRTLLMRYFVSVRRGKTGPPVRLEQDTEREYRMSSRMAEQLRALLERDALDYTPFECLETDIAPAELFIEGRDQEAFDAAIRELPAGG